jgi:transcription-repair coupling factor (superfamily II helicase)
MVKNQGERWWNKIEQRHDRSGIGNARPPEDIYLSPLGSADDRLDKHCGLELDQLGASTSSTPTAATSPKSTSPRAPRMRFHGSIPALIDAQRAHEAGGPHPPHRAQPGRSRAPRQPAAGVQIPLPPRLSARTARGSEPSTRIQLPRRRPAHAGHRATSIARRQVLDLDKANARQIVIFGANDLSDEADVTARPVRRRANPRPPPSSPTSATSPSATTSSTSSTASPSYQGLKEIEQDGIPARVHDPRIRRRGALYVPLTRLDLIQKYRSTEGAPRRSQQARHAAMGRRPKPASSKAMQDMADELLKLYASARPRRARLLPDNDIQREFEDAFDFNETDDQLTAIADIKRDMESTSPWTACSAATSATAKPKSPCAPPSRPCRTTSRSPCSRPPPSSASSTSKPSSSASPTSPSTSR